MEIKYIFTDKEKKLIKELRNNNNSFNYSIEFDKFRDEYKDELIVFAKEGLIHHSNSGSEGSYIRFSVTDKGLSVFQKVK